MIRIIQLTDLHIIGDSSRDFLGLDSLASFRAVLDAVKEDVLQTKADLVVLTGDLSQDHSEAAYKHIRKELKFFDTHHIPVTWLPGNHDNPAVGEQILGKCQKQYIYDHWNIVLLNSHYAGHISGMVDQDDLEFLDEALAACPDKHVTVMIHHHLIPCETKWLDTMMVENRNEVLDILTKYSNVKLVIYGHIHQELQQQYKNITFLAAPATSVQFVPHLPQLKLANIMPGYRWLELNDDGTFTTAVQRIAYDSELVPDLTIQRY